MKKHNQKNLQKVEANEALILGIIKSLGKEEKVYKAIKTLSRKDLNHYLEALVHFSQNQDDQGELIQLLEEDFDLLTRDEYRKMLINEEWGEENYVWCPECGRAYIAGEIQFNSLTGFLVCKYDDCDCDIDGCGENWDFMENLVENWEKVPKEGFSYKRIEDNPEN